MTGVILAGGQSRRMGSNKAFIEIDGVPIIERALGVFKAVFDDVFIAAGDVLLYANLDTRVVADVFPGAGGIGGVYTALFHSTDNMVFVAACDMPFLDPACIKRVLDEKKVMGRFEAAAPFIGNRAHPMHALYSRRCMKPIEAMIKEGNLRINDLLSRIRVKQLTEEAFGGLPIAESVENVNTREELRRVRKGE